MNMLNEKKSLSYLHTTIQCIHFKNKNREEHDFWSAKIKKVFLKKGVIRFE